ncbi:MAG: hypothetical protein M3218_00375 [Thermoproteota archaeon]|jgi:hypothetical protein|nr:hypothetical protein [Thermoproteota archaeon]
MSDERMTLFELKETAKWSSDPEERKAAIKELSTHGENAIYELQEIANITAYEDIKNACAEAIKSMQQARKGVEVNKTSSSSTIDSSNSAADDVVVTKDQKKEKIENEEKKPKARERDLNQAS